MIANDARTTTMEARQWQRFGRHVVAATLAACVLGGWCAAALAEVAMPEHRVTSRREVNGHPALSALGSSVMGTCAADGDSGGVEVDVSLDAGFSWFLGTRIIANAAALGIDLPTAPLLAADGQIHLATDNLGVRYHRGTGLTPIVWDPYKVVLGVYNPDLLGYELHSIAANAALGQVYICSTENTADADWSSTALFTRSLDDGGTWSVPQRLSSMYSKGSNLVVGPDGDIHVAWVDYSVSRAMVTRSLDHGASFEPPVPAADMLDNLDAMPLGWHIPDTPERNYPWYREFSFAPNFPALAVDRSPGATRGNLYLTWAEYADGDIAPATQTVLESQAPDETPATAQPVPVDCDLYGAVDGVEYGTDPWDYYALDLAAGETLWLDGRGYNETIRCYLYPEPPSADFQNNLGSIRLMTPLDVPAYGRPKGMVFTAPRTGRYYLFVTTTFYGSGYQLNLRHYTPRAGSAARDMRDIVLVRSTDGGLTWSPKVRVNHDAAGHDQCMPNVAVDGRGDVYVAWYDRRDAAAGDSVWAYAAVSHDGGQTFGADLRLSSRGSAWLGRDHTLVPLAPGDLVGDRIAIAAGEDYGLVAWADFRDWPVRSDIYAARIVDVPTGVEAVTDLAAEAGADGVRLAWVVNDARAVAALRVYRAGEGEAEVALGEADLVPSGAGRLDYLDASAEPGRTYAYRLQVRSASGTRWLGPVTVSLPARITALAWRSGWPNPFAGRLAVTLAIPRAGAGAVRVYDVQGKQVRTLAVGRFEPGERAIEWDGRDASGGAAAPGIYFVSAQVGGEQARLRVARVR